REKHRVQRGGHGRQVRTGPTRTRHRFAEAVTVRQQVLTFLGAARQGDAKQETRKGKVLNRQSRSSTSGRLLPTQWLHYPPISEKVIPGFSLVERRPIAAELVQPP